MARRSQKTQVIEWLFFNRTGFDASSGTIPRTIMTFQDVVEGIKATGASLETNNPANFWKDITRKNPNTYWPKTVLASGYTGKDAIGGGSKACFEFVPLPEGQSTAFPVGLEPPAELFGRIQQVQSLSMPMATKALGRRDENWLAQVAARLAIVETHFAVFSSSNIAEATFLQTGVKMKLGEVDSAYSLTGADKRTWLLSVEAKGRQESIHEPQVLRAARALSASPAAKDVAGVIPFAIKIVGDSLIYTAEFEPLSSDQDDLNLLSEGLIELTPVVKGIY